MRLSVLAVLVVGCTFVDTDTLCDEYGSDDPRSACGDAEQPDPDPDPTDAPTDPPEPPEATDPDGTAACTPGLSRAIDGVLVASPMDLAAEQTYEVCGTVSLGDGAIQLPDGVSFVPGGADDQLELRFQVAAGNTVSITGIQLQPPSTAPITSRIGQIDGELVLENMVVDCRHAQGAVGGFAIGSDGRMVIGSSTIQGCRTSGQGGAIHSEGTLELDDVAFVANEAADGGAVWTDGDAALGTARFENNLATGDGGAVYAQGSLTNARGSSFIDNTAQRGGAVYASGDIDLRGIFTGNRALDAGHIAFTPGQLGTDAGLQLNNEATDDATAHLYGGTSIALYSAAIQLTPLNEIDPVAFESPGAITCEQCTNSGDATFVRHGSEEVPLPSGSFDFSCDDTDCGVVP